MGNAPSAPSRSQSASRRDVTKRAATQVQWGWEFQGGRAVPKVKRQTTPKPKRPLLRKLPSDNYDWWIFNPDISSAKRRNINS